MPAPTMMTLLPAAVARKACCDRLSSTASTRASIAVGGIISSDNSLQFGCAYRMRSGAHTSHTACIYRDNTPLFGGPTYIYIEKSQT